MGNFNLIKIQLAFLILLSFLISIPITIIIYLISLRLQLGFRTFCCNRYPNGYLLGNHLGTEGGISVLLLGNRLVIDWEIDWKTDWETDWETYWTTDWETVRQSNIQLTCYSYRRNCDEPRLRCSLLNCNYTLQVLQQVATNDYKQNGRCITQIAKHECASVCIL